MARKAGQTGEATVATLSAGRRRAILAARAEQLARRAEAADTTPLDRLLVCAVGANLYGFPLEQVSRVRPFERLGAAPTQQAATLGLVVDNGEIRPALDLGSLLGHREVAGDGGWLLMLAPPLTAALRVVDLPASATVKPLESGDGDRARVEEGEHADKVLVRLSAPDLLAAYANPLHGAVAP